MKLPEWVVAYIQNLPYKYTGKIELNCFKGNVGNLNLILSVKEDTETQFVSPETGVVTTKS